MDQTSKELKEICYRVFSPSRPVTSRELLKGRAHQLSRAIEALEVPGRSVFVYGERGVGKTSLAQTVANNVNSDDTEPVLYGCMPDTTFGGLIAHIVRKLLDLPQLKGRTETWQAALKLSVVEITKTIVTQHEKAPVTIDVNDAIDILNGITKAGGDKTRVVVIDEIDVVASFKFKQDLAFFVKQVGDQGCQVKFVFAGIAQNIDELLAQHESMSRYIAPVHLEPLRIEAMRSIVSDGFEQLGCDIWQPFATRIALLSDGFAHFTHLVCLKLALMLIDRPSAARKVDKDCLARAIHEAVEDSEVWLKNAYEKAVQKYQDEYAPILWAAADHWQLLRSTEHMYDSYVWICGELGRAPLPRSKFSQRLHRLKQETHGHTLLSERLSWYRFRIAMLRGYCRIVAEDRGVEIGLNYLDHQERPKAIVGSGGDSAQSADTEPDPDESGPDGE